MNLTSPQQKRHTMTPDQLNRRRLEGAPFHVLKLNIFRRLETLETKQKELEKTMLTTQQQVDALASGLVTLDGTVQTVQAEVTALEAANPSVDFTAANAALAKLQTDVGNLAATAAGSPATS